MNTDKGLDKNPKPHMVHQAMNTCLHGFTSFRLSFLSCDPRAFSLLEYQASPSHILFDTTVVKVNLEMTEKVVPNTFSSF